MKRLIPIFLSLIILLSLAVPFNAYAEETVIEITKEQMTENAVKYIKKAFNTAKDKATDENPYTVILPSGTYNLKDCLHIYSNTNLVLQEDTVLVKKFEENNMIKLGVNKEVNKGYNGYRNITISGGIWDCNYTGDSCIMRFAHCKNIVLKDTVLRNQKDAHHMELAAANNFLISNCSYQNYKKTQGGDGEAIQIDPIHTTYHFPGYYEYDDTPCKNITVDSCSFSNIFAGVGTRSGVIGSYFNNIKITNNTFDNIKDKAICAFNYRNSEISNNTISNATLGIIFEYFPTSNLLGKLYTPNYNKNPKIVKSTNTVIKNNTINVSNRTSRSNSAGIAVYGGIISKNYSKTTGLKAGKYYVENLNVNHNTITVKSASSYGMILQYTNKCNIVANSFVTSSKSKKSGVLLYNSDSNSLSANTVKGFLNGYSFTEKSRKNALNNNAIKNNRHFAVIVDKTSRTKIFWGNSIKGNKKGKLQINSKKYPLYGSTIKLNVKKGSKVNKLTWKKVRGSGYKVYRSTKKDGEYKLIATVKGRKRNVYKDKHKKGKTYYYKVQAYKSANKSVIYGKFSNIK